MSATDADDRRVQFDFEIDFANGGGIQGQGFRLDIDGEDISDEELGDYVIRDLRLLMVSETRIRNKTIIAERHKRGPEAVKGSEAGRAQVDLSHAVEDGMITYPGLPAPVITDVLSRKPAATITHPAPSSRSDRSS